MAAADAAKIAKKIITFIKSRLFLKFELATDSKPAVLIRLNLNFISSLKTFSSEKLYHCDLGVDNNLIMLIKVLGALFQTLAARAYESRALISLIQHYQ